MTHVSLQPFDFFYDGAQADMFFIEVEEGSELLHVGSEERDGFQKFIAWCFITPGLPFTRRYFRVMGPGTTVYDRASLEYVGPVYEGDSVLWLVFEDKKAKLDWVKENKK